MTVMRKVAGALAFSVSLAPQLASAGIQVQGTRFIYPGDAREIAVELHNDADRPALVQSWLDSGDASADPGTEQLPFVVLPPLVRVGSHAGQTLRIGYTGEALPSDRESVFWLNVLDVPPRAEDGDDRNIMRLAFRTRVKLFFRPDGLPGTLQETAEQLTWSVEPTGDGYVLRAHNEGAYYVSFADVTLNAGGHRYESNDSGMVAPHGIADFTLDGLTSSVMAGEVIGYWLNDFGTRHETSYSLTTQ